MKDIVESLSVAPMELTGKLWKVKVIQEGQGSSANYKGEILEREAHKFQENTRIYMNHPTLSERDERPVRDAREIIGVMKSEGVYDKSDRAIYQHAKIYPEWQSWVKERAEDGVIGLSVRAQGDVEESTGDLKSFEKILSVDLVTEAGAGGGFHSILESANGKAPVGEPREEEQMEFPKELADALDAQAKDVKTLIESVKPLVAALEESKATAEKERKALEESKKPSYVEIDKALTEAKLPAASRATVIALVESGKDLKESVDAEAEKVKQILESSEDGVGGNVNDEGNITESKSAADFAKSIWG